MPGPSAQQQPASGEPLVEFVEVMRRLRAECPWKAAQTHSSLARYLQEEAHETLEAIDAGEASGDWEHLREELGDLLLQVYFHAAIAEERGEWSIDDVAADIVAKLRRRNPHVFGEGAGSAYLTAEDVNAEWERLKVREKSHRTSVTDGLPPGLPALLYADKVLDRLSRAADVDPGQPSRRTSPGTSDTPAAVGASSDVPTAVAASSDVPTAGAAPSSDVPNSVDTAADVALGERLLELVAEARAAGVDPEQALRHAVRRRVEAAEG